jgi:uncharacterized protein YpuA (DUF1002 family)
MTTGSTALAIENEALRQQLATLKNDLKLISKALDDPRVDLTMTMSDVILDLRQKLHEISLDWQITQQQLAAFQSAAEHVTENGCTRRSFVAMPEGWAMIHKDRLHELEVAEEKLAANEAKE